VPDRNREHRYPGDIVRLRPTESGTPVDQSGPDVTPLPAVVPPVVVVMVTHDPGPWFEDTLASIAAQTYADLGVVVVDTASEVDPSDRVRDQLPDARIHVLEHDPGYGAAANTATGLVEGAAFYLFLHDDVALEPDSVRALVEEAFRSNAGVIGPKLVDWHDPTRLLQVGLGADKTGVLAPYAEVGELDQEQHDAVRDVFAVPGACTLVRTDLFEALHGFDEAIDYLGEDLDLCWRAHTLGARVMVAPGARVRHLEAMGERIPIDDRRRRLARHRLRTTLVSYGWWSRLKVLPQAIIWALVEALYGVLSGHPAQARDVLSAWPWNLRRYKTARARRKLLKVARGVKDSDVREFQVNGSARFNALVRGQLLRRDDRVTTFTRSSRDMIGSLQAGSRQFTGAFALVLGVLLAVSSRELLIDPIPAIGELARFPSAPGDLIASWWSGWSRDGLGGAAGQPTAHLLLGLASFVMFGATGLLRTVLIVGMVPLGALGAWRLARPIGSARASVAAFAVYLAIPVPYNALARGSWSGLVAYAAAPWVMLMLGRASGVAPFGPVSLDGDDAESIPAGTQGEPSRGAEVGVDGRAGLPATRRRMGGLILGLGLLLALTAAIVPSFVVIAAAMGLALALGSVLCFRVAGVARMLAVTGGAVIVAVALHVPWSLELISAPSWWEAVAGVGSTNGGPLTLGRVIRFESGPWGAPPLGWAFLAAGVLPVIIGRSWRLEWAVRAWFVALAAWGVLWAGQAGHLPFGLPAAEVVLAPAAAALALTAALGIASFDTDLRAYTFGWRQVLSVVAALGVVLGALPLGAGLIDGRWRMPARGFGASLDPLVSNHDRPAARVLWIGDPELLPVSGWRFGEDMAYAATDRGVPTVLDRIPGAPPGATPLLAEALTIAQDGRTDRLGHLLAPMGVRYIVVTSRLAPSSTTITGQRHPPRALTAMLAQQLDLEEIPVADGLLVYRNTAAPSARSVLPERDGDRTRFTDAVSDELSGADPALEEESGAVGAAGEVPAPGDVLVSQSADPNWQLRVDGVPLARRRDYGWTNVFTANRAGQATLTYQTPFFHHLVSAGQIALWVAVLVARRRIRRRERAEKSVTATASAVVGSAVSEVGDGQ
jgi:GT2 family glycosyltransferase